MDLRDTNQLWAVTQAAQRVAKAARARYNMLEATGLGGDDLAAAQSELADADCVEESLYALYEKAVVNHG